LGHVVLIVSGTPAVIKTPHGAAAAFAIAIITIGCGTGGFKSNLSPLVAEQYRHTKPYIRTQKDGSRIIIDPILTASRIYMYFYLFTNIGALVGQIGMTYAEKYVGFWLAYTLPTAVFLLCPLVLFLGHKRYICSPPSGSVLSKSLHAWKFAAKGRWTFNPIKFIRNFRAKDFWNQAKPSHLEATSQPKPTWMTYDDEWVDELRRGFKACAVFVWYPIYWLTYNQCNSNLVSQAATMNTHGLPNDVLSNLDPLALIILIPILDRLVYPALRRGGIRLTPIRKITMGFYTGAAAMIWAAVVQHYVYKTSPCGYSAGECKDDAGHALVSPLNVWIQSGSYILIAISEILAIITGLEYAFTKAPKNMRSLVTAIFLAMNAFSSAIGEAFVSLSADPLLIWNYGSMAVLAFIAGTIFWFQFRHLDQEEDKLNALAVGHVQEKNT